MGYDHHPWLIRLYMCHLNSAYIEIFSFVVSRSWCNRDTAFWVSFTFTQIQDSRKQRKAYQGLSRLHKPCYLSTVWYQVLPTPQILHKKLQRYDIVKHSCNASCYDYWPSVQQCWHGACFNMKTIFRGIGIYIIKIRWLWDHLIFKFIIASPPLVRQHLYIETVPYPTHNFWNLSSTSITKKAESWSSLQIIIKRFIFRHNYNKLKSKNSIIW